MKNNTESNDFAFSNEAFLCKGLTKREYFAAKAMEGLCSLSHPVTAQDAARRAVNIADALIEALNK